MWDEALRDSPAAPGEISWLTFGAAPKGAVALNRCRFAGGQVPPREWFCSCGGWKKGIFQPFRIRDVLPHRAIPAPEAPISNSAAAPSHR